MVKFNPESARSFHAQACALQQVDQPVAQALAQCDWLAFAACRFAPSLAFPSAGTAACGTLGRRQRNGFWTKGLWPRC